MSEPRYNRSIFEKEFNKAKARLAKATGNYHTDSYTGEPLVPGGRWDFDHIISAKKFSTLAGVGDLPSEIQAKILSSVENIAITDRGINQSKGKYELDEWLFRKSSGRKVTNAEFYGIDANKALKMYEKAQQFLVDEVRKAGGKKSSDSSTSIFSSFVKLFE